MKPAHIILTSYIAQCHQHSLSPDQRYADSLTSQADHTGRHLSRPAEHRHRQPKVYTAHVYARRQGAVMCAKLHTGYQHLL
jgi:hypothetical protein